jgi:hypothetical protein
VDDDVEAGLGGSYPAVRAALNELGLFDDIVAEGSVQPQGAAVALLYSESADIWFGSTGTSGAALRSLYIALRHSELPVDIVTEEDAESGRLHYYHALYMVTAQLSANATTAIISWVKKGGRVFAGAGAGMLTEANQTNAPMQDFLGVQQHALYTGTNRPGRYSHSALAAFAAIP